MKNRSLYALLFLFSVFITLGGKAQTGAGTTCLTPQVLNGGPQSFILANYMSFYHEYVSLANDRVEVVILSPEIFVQQNANFRVLKNCDDASSVPIEYTDTSFIFYAPPNDTLQIAWDYYLYDTSFVDVLVNITQQTPPVGYSCNNATPLQMGVNPTNMSLSNEWYVFQPLDTGFLKISSCQYSPDYFNMMVFNNCNAQFAEYYLATCDMYSYLEVIPDSTYYFTWDMMYGEKPSAFDAQFSLPNEAEFLMFKTDQQIGQTFIDQINRIIEVNTSFYANLSELMCDFMTSPGSIVTQNEIEIFPGSFLYAVDTMALIVTSADYTNSTTWTVIVTQEAAPLAEKDILSFNLAEQVYSEVTADSVYVLLPPYASSCQNVNFELSPQAILYDDYGYEQFSMSNYCFNIDFPTIWSVMAEDSSWHDYTVLIEQEMPPGMCETPYSAVDGINTTTFTSNQYEMWYVYTPVEDGLLHINTCNTNAPDFIFIEPFFDCNNYIYGDVQYCGQKYNTTIQVSANTPYLIRVYNANGNPVVFDWELQLTIPPAGAECISSIEVFSNDTIYSITDTLFKVWYEYTATMEGVVEISTCGLNNINEVYLNVYRDCNYDYAFFNYMGCEQFQGKWKIPVMPGETYKLEWRSYNPAIDFAWNIIERPAIPGETCNSPLSLFSGIDMFIPQGEMLWTEYSTTLGSKVEIVPNNPDLLMYVNEQIRVVNSCDPYDQTFYYFTDSSIVYYQAPETSQLIIWEFYNIEPDYVVNLTIYETQEPPPPGLTCTNPEVAALGINSSITGLPDQWFTFTPQEDGYLKISTCDLSPSYHDVIVKNDCQPGTFEMLMSTCDEYSYFNCYAGTPILINWNNRNSMIPDQWDLQFFPTSDVNIYNWTFEESIEPSVIDDINHTITCLVSYYADLTQLYTMFELAPEAYMLDGEFGFDSYNYYDFSTAKTLTVVSASDTISQNWTVTVNQATAPSAANDIINFAVQDQIQSVVYNDTVLVEVPLYSDGCYEIFFETSPLSYMTDESGFEVFSGNYYCYELNIAHLWTVTAENGDVKNWTVIFYQNIPEGMYCENAVPALIGMNEYSNVTDVQNEIWYSYIVSENSKLTINTCTGAFPPNAYVEVMRGCNYDFLYMEEMYCETGNRIFSADVMAGEMVYIRFSNVPPLDLLQWNLEERIPQPGETCEMPLMIDQGTITTPVDQARYEYWYEYVTSSEGFLILNTCDNSSGADIWIEAMNDCMNYNVDVSESDCGSGTQYYIEVMPGERYIFRLSTYFYNYIDTTFSFTISEREYLPGETCAMPRLAQLGINVANPYNLPIEEYIYTYTPDMNGVVTLSTCGLTPFDTWIYATRGLCDENSIIAASDDKCGVQSEIYFNAHAGETYFFSLGNKYPHSFQWELSIDTVTQLPPGASCETPIDLMAGENLILFDNMITWMTYTASQDSKVSLQANLDGYGEVELHVVNGCSIAIEHEVIYEDSSAYFWANAGETYYMVLVIPQLPGIEIPLNVTETPGYPPVGSLCADPIPAMLGMNTADNSEGYQWFLYTPQRDGYLVANSCGYTNDSTLVRIFESCQEYMDNAHDYNFDYMENQPQNCWVGSRSIRRCFAGEPMLIVWENHFSHNMFDWELSVIPDDMTAFINYSIYEQTQPAVIIPDSSLIRIEVGQTTNLQYLHPVFTLPPDAIAYINGIEQFQYQEVDFTDTVTYTIVAANGINMQDWQVVVVAAPQIFTGSDILSINFDRQIGPTVMDNINKTIEATISWDTYGCTWINMLETSPMAHIMINDNEGIYQGYYFCVSPSTPQPWVVYAEDGSSTQWTVTLHVQDPPPGFDCSFPIVIQEGTHRLQDGLSYYRFDAPTSGLIELGSINQDDNAYISVYDTTCTGLIFDDYIDYMSNITFYVEAGESYIINIDSYNYDQLEWYLQYIIPNTEAELFGFRLVTENIEIFEGALDVTNNIVNVNIPFSTPITALMPGFEVSDGATVYIDSIETDPYNMVYDFSADVAMEIVSQDSITTNMWTVSVTQNVAEAGTDIVSFEVPGQNQQAFIDLIDHNVELFVPFDVTVTNLTSFFSLSPQAVALYNNVEIVSGLTSFDFTSPVLITVIAENGDSQIWTIQVTELFISVEELVVEPEFITLFVGESIMPDMMVYPFNASNPDINIELSDTTLLALSEFGIETLNVGDAYAVFATTDGSNLVDTIFIEILDIPIFVTNVQLPDTIYINQGMSITVYPQIIPQDANYFELMWQTELPEIASVSQDGVLTGNFVGETWLWAEVYSEQQFITNFSKVIVSEVAVSDILLSVNGSIDMMVGDNFIVEATVLPTTATNREVFWTSTNPEFFVIDSLSGRITAIAAGVGQITAHALSNPEITASLGVNVLNIPVDRTELQTEVDSANNLINYVTTNNLIGINTGQYPQTALDSLITARTAAEGILSNTNANQSTVDGATIQLHEAIIAFLNRRIGNIRIAAIDIARDSLMLSAEDDPVLLRASISPLNATYRVLQWTTSNSTVAMVDAYGLVSPVGAGTAYIYAISTDGSDVYDSCKVMVTATVQSIVLPQMVTVIVGNTIHVTPQILPSTAVDVRINWSSENPSIAQVDSIGNITGLQQGFANIIAQVEGTGIMAVTIANVAIDTIAVAGISIPEQIEMVIGEEVIINPQISPRNATNPSVIWNTTDALIAYEYEGGIIQALSVGSAIITATTVDGGFADSCIITVHASDAPEILTTPSVNVPSNTDSIVFNLSNIVADDNTSVSSLTVETTSDNFTIVRSGNTLIAYPIVSGWVGSDTVTVVVTDLDGRSVTSQLYISMSDLGNTAPSITTILDQTIMAGSTFNLINLNNKVTDDYTSSDLISWETTATINLVAHISNGYLEVTLRDNEWIGTDSITVFAYDESGLFDNETIVFTVADIENQAPVILSIPTQIQTEEEPFSTVDLTMYVQDDYTQPEYINWETSASNKFNIDIDNGVISISIVDQNWCGTEVITLYATDEYGLTSTGSLVYVQSIQTSSTWEGRPSVSFSALKQTVGVGDMVQFTSSISGLGTPEDSWLWIFDGGTPSTSNDLNPSVYYADAGVYTVSLIAQNTYGTDTLIRENYITVFGIEQADTILCTGDSLTLSLNINTMAAYTWSNGSNATSITIYPAEQTVYSIVAEEGLFTYTDSIVVDVAAELVLPNDTSICAGDMVTITPATYTNYNWNNSGWSADSTYTTMTAASTVSLSVIDEYGCESTDSVSIIEVYPLPVVELGVDTSICFGTTITLDAGSGNSYIWSNDSTSQTIAVSDSGSYAVTVTSPETCISTDAILVNVLRPYAEQIGIATYSDDGSSIVVAWQRTTGKRTAYYELYRETGTSNEYDLIQTRGIEDSLYFVDRDANAVQQAYRYKLVTYDSTCNNSVESIPHKTMKLTQSEGLEAHEANFEWNGYIGIDVPSYKVFIVESTGLTEIGSVAGDGSEYYAFTYQEHVSSNRYRVGFDIEEFALSTLKSESGPFSQSLSNIAELSVEPISVDEDNFDIQVYPNPVSDKLNIRFNQDISDVQIQLVTSTGSVIEKVETNATDNEIVTMDVSGIKAGNYSLKISSNGNEDTYQVIKR